MPTANTQLCMNNAEAIARKNEPKYNGFRQTEYGPSAITELPLRPPTYSVAQNRKPSPAK